MVNEAFTALFIRSKITVENNCIYSFPNRFLNNKNIYIQFYDQEMEQYDLFNNKSINQTSKFSEFSFPLILLLSKLKI